MNRICLEKYGMEFSTLWYSKTKKKSSLIFTDKEIVPALNAFYFNH